MWISSKGEARLMPENLLGHSCGPRLGDNCICVSSAEREVPGVRQGPLVLSQYLQF